MIQMPLVMHIIVHLQYSDISEVKNRRRSHFGRTLKRVFSRGSKVGKIKSDSLLGELSPQGAEATSTSIDAQSESDISVYLPTVSVPALLTQGMRRISLQDVTIVEHALRHDDECQIQGCHCYSIKTLLGRTKLHKPYTVGSTTFDSNNRSENNRSESNRSESNRSESNRSCDSGYGSGPVNHLYQNSHLETHLHYPQVPTNHYLPYVCTEAPTYGIRSKQLSDLTPLFELPEQVEYPPMVSTDSDFGYKDSRRKRPLSLTLVTDRNPYHPPYFCSPLKDGSRSLIKTSGRRKGSFQRGSTQSTNSKPQLKTVKVYETEIQEQDGVITGMITCV